MKFEPLESRHLLSSSPFFLKDLDRRPAYVTTQVETALIETAGSSFHLESDELWARSVETDESVRVLENTSTLEYIGVVGPRILFRDTQHLWSSDGTSNGTTRLSTLPEDAVFWNLGQRWVATSDRRMLSTDGTIAGTQEILPVTFGALATVRQFHDRLLFRPFSNLRAIGVTDGTVSGTYTVEVAAPTANPAVYDPWENEVYIDNLGSYEKATDRTPVASDLFNALDAADMFSLREDGSMLMVGTALWRRTADSLVRVAELPDEAFAKTIVGDTLFYAVANDPPCCRASSSQIRGIAIPTGNDRLVYELEFPIVELLVWNEQFFVEYAETSLVHRIKTVAVDGTSENSLVEDPTLASRHIGDFADSIVTFWPNSDGFVYFREQDEFGDALVRTDGREVEFVFRRYLQNGSSDPQEIHISEDGRAFVRGRDYIYGGTLDGRMVSKNLARNVPVWANDGYVVTQRLEVESLTYPDGLARIFYTPFDHTSQSLSFPLLFPGPLQDVVHAGDLVAFFDYNATVWVVNLRTNQLQELGSHWQMPSFTMAAGVVLFEKTTDGRRELWRSDATEVGTYRLLENYQSASPIVDVHGSGFFVITRQDASELWTTDGTAEGTRIVYRSEDKTLLFQSVEPYQDHLILRARRGDSHVVTTDGAYLYPLPSDSGRRYKVFHNDWMFYDGFDFDTNQPFYSPVLQGEISHIRIDKFQRSRARDGDLYIQDGRSVAKIPRDSEDVIPVTELGLELEPADFNPRMVDVVDEVLYLSAFDPAHGRELWAVDVQSDKTPGDANRDGLVNFDDFLILSEMFGRHGEDLMHRHGDFDENGRVDFADFLILSQAFQGDS